MNLDSQNEAKEIKNRKDNMENNRRNFLKKVYVAPTIIVLGGLLKPTKSEAGFGDPPSDAGAGGF